MLKSDGSRSDDDGDGSQSSSPNQKSIAFTTRQCTEMITGTTMLPMRTITMSEPDGEPTSLCDQVELACEDVKYEVRSVFDYM